ncbi:hypothetical protein O181_094095 [Austropuccinia psidii MF-1]|uniref:Uncharacterized protein n=1 Tax=Austropuccinia psidii MF-1 TaxID=1389203 RepID=A0A9Q3J2Y6_9BASI|nr:hypothetical protein [Austropuccinia psidii MF-1]
MPIQHSPLEIQTISQARAQAILIPTPGAPLDGTPSEGREPRILSSFSGIVGSFPGLSRTTFKGPAEDAEEEEENSVEEGDSYGTEGVPAPVEASQGTGGPTLAQANQSEPSLLAIMQKMRQIMANPQAASYSKASRPPAFKALECVEGTFPFKVRSLIQSYQLIFHNDLANFSEDRNKVLHSTSFLICRDEK